VIDSARFSPITIVKSGNAVGKAQPVDTMIPTPQGWRRLGDLTVGDLVFTASGTPTKIIGVYPQGKVPTYKIKFNDNTQTMACQDHLWVIRSSHNKSRKNPWKVVTTKDLPPIIHRHIHIPMCDPVEYQHRDLPVDPYVIGALLGDGGLTLKGTIIITIAEDEILDRISRSLPGTMSLHKVSNSKFAYIISNGQKGRRTPNVVKNYLDSVGLLGLKSHEKFIPREYLQADIKQRIDLLRGLMDTDGYIGKAHTSTFTTTSPRLASDFCELIQSLGGTAKIHNKSPFYRDAQGNKIYCKTAYNVNIKLPFCPFYLSRKTERYVDERTLQKQAHRLIESVEYIGEVESVCIRVEDESQLYLTENFIVTHNSHVASRIGIWYFMAYQDSKIYMTAAPPLENLKQILWGEVLNVVRNKPMIFAGLAMKRLYIARNSGSFMTGVAIPTSGTPEEREAKFSGKHSPHLMFIIDEGDGVPDEVYKGIESCMSGGEVRLIVLFNPRAKTGPVYEKEKNRQANIIKMTAMDHPNVVTGRDVIPGAVSREITIRRINMWTRPISPLELIDPERVDVFKVPDYLVGKSATSLDGKPFLPLPEGLRQVIRPEFSYMVLGEYPLKGANMLIQQEWVDSARSRWDSYVAVHGEIPPMGANGIMGLDVAELGVDANVACFRYGGFVKSLISWSGVDPYESAQRAMGLYRTNNINIAMIDGMGVGAGVAPAMARQGREFKIRAVSVKANEKPTKMTTEKGEFKILRDQMWWELREWLRTDPGAMLPPDYMLIEEITAPFYQEKNGKIMVTDKETLRDMLKRSPDRADALCLTFSPFERPKVIRLEG